MWARAKAGREKGAGRPGGPGEGLQRDTEVSLAGKVYRRMRARHLEVTEAAQPLTVGDGLIQSLVPGAGRG